MVDAAPLRPALWSAHRIGTPYILLAGLWIVFSDRALEAWLVDPSRITAWQTYKGWGFVLVSGVFIVALSYREIRRREESEGRFRSLVDQTLVGVYIIRDGRFLYVNTRLAEIFGFDQAEMVRSVRVADVVEPDDRELVLGHLRRRETGQIEEVNYRFGARRKGGEQLHVEVFGRRIEIGGEAAVIGVLVDRTEQQRLENVLRQAQRMEAIGQLTGAVAHDFNNLLTAIITPLEICIQEMEDGDRLRRELTEVRLTAGRAAELTRQLLTFSRKRIDEPKVISPDGVLGNLSPMLSRLLPEGISLRVEPGELERNVRIDPSGLEQVILNLVVNARDAMPTGGGITVRTYPHEVGLSPGEDEVGHGLTPGAYVCLEVRDTGQGMDPAILDKIFEPFFTTKHAGTGLGLATVFGLAQKAGGTVQVTSSPGEGATFKVLLPTVDSPAATDAPDVERKGAEREAAPGGGGAILVVEDNERVRAVTVAALTRFGYQTFAVTGVQAALDFARTSRGAIDLLLTDVMLDDGTGPQLAEAYAGIHPELKVLFMSGYSDDEAMGDVERLEGVAFLEKPFSLDALAVKVAKALSGPELNAIRRSA